jgi:hypothetical protein
MAIYGAGSKWNDDEMCQVFFRQERFVLGWNDENAKDLYEAITTLKVGDIIYLKSNAPGSRNVRVKGIGVVSKSFIQNITDGDYQNVAVEDWDSLFVTVNWVRQDEFIVQIPNDEGKLTNIRAASFYEEFLPFVQEAVLNALFPDE